MRRSTRPRLLEQMQNLVMLKHDDPLPEFAEPVAGLNLVVNSSLGMSDGKTLAQLGHGALRPVWPEAEVDPNLPVSVYQATAEQLDALATRYDVWVVQDAGFTEIAPGSETVVVLAS
jgi:peptidyl-tRNA hydrolase